MNGGSPAKRTKVAAAPVALAPALSSAAAAAVAAVVTGEPALLQNIISFMPSSSADCKTDMGQPSQSALVLKTITALCRAIPGLSRLVGPSNEAFWREMVLAHFDFATSGHRFNVEDWGGDWYNEVDGVDDECDDPDVSADPDAPSSDADAHEGDGDDGEEEDEDEDESDDERYTHPNFFLVDGLAYWSALRAYFKPAAYGFLHKIQRDRSQLAALWPDHEDAFSLFCDLLLLPRFQSNDDVEWETWSDGCQPVYPCLLGRFPTKIVGRGFAMLKFCDFAPYFWTGMKEPVEKRWSGFDGPLPPIECKWELLREQKKVEREAAAQMRLQNKRNEKVDAEEEEGEEEEEEDDDVEDEDDEFEDAEHSECEERTKEERSIFPGSQSHDAHPLLHLRRFVYETFSDWRRVHTSQSEKASPEFYIGSTKRSGRWMGFVGQSDYWA